MINYAEKNSLIERQELSDIRPCQERNNNMAIFLFNCHFVHRAVLLVTSGNQFCFPALWQASVFLLFNWWHAVGIEMTRLSAHQELGHVKRQILNKAELMLGQWRHVNQMGLWLLGDTSGDWAQGDQHHFAAVMSYKRHKKQGWEERKRGLQRTDLWRTVP